VRHAICDAVSSAFCVFCGYDLGRGRSRFMFADFILDSLGEIFNQIVEIVAVT